MPLSSKPNAPREGFKEFHKHHITHMIGRKPLTILSIERITELFDDGKINEHERDVMLAENKAYWEEQDAAI